MTPTYRLPIWRTTYRATARGADLSPGVHGATLGEVAAAFGAWRSTRGADYHSVTFEAGVVVTPLHLFFSVDRLADVVDQMATRGAPRIRAYFDEVSNAWFALEGTHRLRAALLLDVTPVMVPSRWPRGRRALERARYAVERRAHVFPRVEVARVEADR